MVLAVGEHSAQPRDLDAQAAFLDDHAWPDAREEIPLAHHLAGTLDERDQDVELAGTDRDRRIALQKQALGSEKPERPELPCP